jgi:superfamily II DNA/RNA helicase
MTSKLHSYWGIDIPDVQLVVQYQLPASLSIPWQRFGRGARDPNLCATGVVLVESKHFNDEKDRRVKALGARQAKKRRRLHEALLRGESPKQPRLSNLAISTPDPADPVDNKESSDEGSELSEGEQATHSTAQIAQIAQKFRPTKRSKCGKLVEKGLDLFINSHLVSTGLDRCRRKALNKYFKNPTQGKQQI